MKNSASLLPWDMDGVKINGSASSLCPQKPLLDRDLWDSGGIKLLAAQGWADPRLALLWWSLNLPLLSSTPLHPGALIIPCLLPIKRIPYFFSNESSEERNESSPFQWIFRRRVIQVPLWGSKDPGRCSVLVQPVPVQSTCVSTSLRGRGHRLHSITEWCCDSFLCPGEMLLVPGWLNYLPSFTGNMLSMLKKNKNSRSSSEMWPMPLNSPQPLWLLFPQ